MKAGLTATEVAQAVGVDQSTISRIERGKQRPAIDLAAALAKCLALTELEILYPERFTQARRKRRNGHPA